MKLTNCRDMARRNTGHTQNNGAISKVIKKLISHPTRAQRTLSAVEILHVFLALPAVCFSYLLRGLGTSLQDGVSRRRLSVCSVLRCLDLWLQCSVSFVHGLKKIHHPGVISFLNRARNSRRTVITDLDKSKRSTQKAFSCCDAILETGPAAQE
jgi:hypothetical protein